MSLPILKVVSAPTPDTLFRQFHQAYANWSAHVAENSQLDFGTAWVNPELNRVHIANRMMDVQLTDGITPQQAFDQADAHFSSFGSSCLQWVMNPSATAEQTQPMIEFLLARGFMTRTTQVMFLEQMPALLPRGSHEPLQIIPARASFKHVRALTEEAVKYLNEPQLIEARMLHLDDPHYDALLALKDGTPVALAGVLGMGEVGVIFQVYVSEAFRRRGIYTTMMGRMFEICVRSQFKHVMLDAIKEDAHVIRAYEKLGFRPLRELVVYQRQPV